MKFLKFILILIIVLVLAAVVVLGYFGFLPGVSNLFGSNKPRDLGVVYTEADLQSGYDKADVTVIELSANDTSLPQGIKWEGEVVINDAFSDEEVTAMINDIAWKGRLMDDVQVKIHDDGVVEMSGVLRVDHLEEFASAFGYTSEQIEAAKDYLNLVTVNPPFYATGTASVSDGQVSLEVTSAEIGRVGLPADFVTSNRSLAETIIEDSMAKVPGLSAASLTFGDGQMKFDGTYPETSSWVTE
jgi:hypothetical protein